MKHIATRPFAGLVIALLLGAQLALAQNAARDPTVAPGETGKTGEAGVASPSPAGEEGMTVLVRDEKPYLMVGARLYAPGDKIGKLRLQRITEKEVWFHDGSAVIKVPRFAGIERKALAAKPPCTATSKSPPPTVAPCEDTQP